MTGTRNPAGRDLPRARGLLLLALLLWLLYGAATLFGLRDQVAVLTGTYGTMGDAIGGAIYVLLHLGATAVAPILLLAAALVTAVGRVLRQRSSATPTRWWRGALTKYRRPRG